MVNSPARLKVHRSSEEGLVDLLNYAAVVEDGVVFRHTSDDYLLTSAEPNLAWFADRIGRRANRLGGAAQLVVAPSNSRPSGAHESFSRSSSTSSRIRSRR